MRAATQDIKYAITESLKEFGNGSLRTNATRLFNTLGYLSEKTIELSPNTPENFLDEVDQHNRLKKDKALFSIWRSVDFIFQITGEEIKAGRSGQIPLQFDAHRKIDHKIIESYLFLAIKLKKGHHTRTDLSTITREINKFFYMPALILFQHDDTLTLSVINRRLHKRDKTKDVLEKVTLIKDIRFTNPHRAHIEILFDLSFGSLYDRYRFSNFVALHDAWQNTLDINELNKRFYKEIANWYFWAVKEVAFPSQSEIKDIDIRNATNVIRLITRLIFVWFVKEKGLVPDDLFSLRKLQELLKDLSPDKSSYYKAILQNLFFATLNQEMNTPQKPHNRKFRNKAKKLGGRDQHYMIHNVYRYEDYFKSPEQAPKIFENIPFLNGGLFECLDRYDTKPVIRIDGFSDRKDNELHIPNFLFFSDEQTVDLNRDYGTRNKTYKVRGLIDLLQSYKFTITENTPIEEEIALDPELLGKVFENLLASYNPETGTTARKQTGSFYTPREIVDYMVDESLKASLSNLVAENLANSTEGDMRTGLDILFEYTEKDHAFNDEEVSKIVKTVSEIKILDPACGSGAFPMGVLHKLVYILGKLDRNNTQWREIQKQRAIEETEEAYNMGNKEERHQRLSEIEEAFDFNTSDYGRKLYLIENCIYGVDIQPIAVQIAKLRFFISLVVDQTINEAQENRGILPLPNLETKFVAANTLIGIEGPKQRKLPNLMIRATIEKKQKELTDVRRKHFTARTLKTKRKFRDQDAQLRAEISELLKKEDFPPDTTQKLAYWDPYDQNAEADFFDMEWMFNLSGGFDVVIGNPPYGVSFTSEEKKLYNTLFEHQNYQLDSYLLFLEKGVQLARQDAKITYIIPNPWLTNLKLTKIRKFVTTEITILGITHYMRKVFDAVVDTEVVMLKKTKPDDNVVRVNIHEDEHQVIRNPISQRKWQTLNGEPINIFLDKKTKKIIQLMNDNSILLRDIFDAYAGMKPYEKGKGSPKQTREMVRDRVYDASYKKNKYYRQLLRGKDIIKYKIIWAGDRWIKYGDCLAAPRYAANFDAEEKIVIRQTGDSLIAALDTDQFICMNNMHVIHAKNDSFDLRFLLGLINSTLLDLYFQSLNPERGEALAEVKKENIEKLPINKSSKPKKKQIIKFVNKILTITKSEDYLNNSQKKAKIQQLEVEIDARVAHLYGLSEEEYMFTLSKSKTQDPFRLAALNTYRDIVKGRLK